MRDGQFFLEFIGRVFLKILEAEVQNSCFFAKFVEISTKRVQRNTVILSGVGFFHENTLLCVSKQLNSKCVGILRSKRIE